MVRWTGLRRAVVALTALLTGLALSPPVAAAAPQWWNRGTIPLYSTTSAGGETARMPDGSVRTYLAVSGKPAYLAEVDASTGTVMRMIPLYVPDSGSTENPPDTGAQGAWGVSIDKHGTVFVSSYGFGHVYRLPWGGALEDLGRPSPRTSFTWEGDADDRGVFYFGTSEFFGPAPLPGGKLFSWDPKTRQYRDYGDWGPTFGYVRSVEHAAGKVYAGLGPSVGLWQVDPKSGERVQIPAPAGMPTDKYAYQLEDEGGYLYVLFAGGTTAQVGWVLNLRTLEWEHEIPGYMGQTITAADRHGRSYLLVDGELKLYDPKRGVLTGTGFKGGPEQADKGGLGAGKGLARVLDKKTKHETVIGATSGGDLWRYDTVTETGTFSHLDDLVGTPTAPRSLAKGPDGKIYAGGYFQGGLAVYDPATTTWTEYPFAHQIEGMSVHDGKMYFGVYPNAQLWEYDPAQPFGATNPKQLFELKSDGQERPWTVVSAGRYLAIGTSPKNSQANGAVTLYDPATGSASDVELGPGHRREPDLRADLPGRGRLRRVARLLQRRRVQAPRAGVRHGRGVRRRPVAVHAAAGGGRCRRADVRRAGPALRPDVRDDLRAGPGERRHEAFRAGVRLQLGHGDELPAARGEHGLRPGRRRHLHDQRHDPPDRSGHAGRLRTELQGGVRRGVAGSEQVLRPGRRPARGEVVLMSR